MRSGELPAPPLHQIVGAQNDLTQLLATTLCSHHHILSLRESNSAQAVERIRWMRNPVRGIRRAQDDAALPNREKGILSEDHLVELVVETVLSLFPGMP